MAAAVMAEVAVTGASVVNGMVALFFFFFFPWGERRKARKGGGGQGFLCDKQISLDDQTVRVPFFVERSKDLFGKGRGVRRVG